MHAQEEAAVPQHLSVNRDPSQTLASFPDYGQGFQVAKQHGLCVVLLVVVACTPAVIKEKDLRGL